MRGRWKGALVASGFCAGILAGAIADLGAAPPAQAIGGLDTTATATYTVDFAAGVVHVRVDFSFHNAVPDRPTADGSESTYFAGYQFWVPGDAANVTARAGDRPLSIPVAPDDQFQVASIEFGTNLEYEDRLDVVVMFDLPGYAPRADEAGRANEAFAAFVARGFGDPGAGTVRIVTPTRADVAIPALDDGSLPRPQVVSLGGVTTRTFRALPQPNRFALLVTAANDRKLVERRVHVEGRDVVVQAWPDDARWRRFVTREVRSALPMLADLVGRRVRDRHVLILRESARPGLEGYTGWYDYATGVIEVGERLDPVVTIHELAHGWFNEDTSYHRWITEGLAETYANAVVERTGGQPRRPARPAAGVAGRQPLNDWENFDFSQQEPDTEKYGYDTSYFVVDALVDEIGSGRMSDVLAAVDDGTPAYGPPATVRPGPVGWQRFLDLLEQVGGSERAGPLFRRYVVAPEDRDDLDARTDTREDYRELANRAGTWAPPAGVRAGMERWEFSDAAELIAVADRAIAARDDFVDAAAGTGIELPSAIRSRFENARRAEALEAVSDEIAELADVMDVVLATEAAAHADRSPLEALALGGEDFNAQLAEARDAISNGDPQAAALVVSDIRSELAVAAAVGRQRAEALTDNGLNRLGLVGAAAGAVLVLAAMLTWAARRRWRRRSLSGDDATHLDAAGDAPVDGDIEAGVGERVDLDEDALAGAGFGGVNGGLDVASGDTGERTGPAGVVERGPELTDVGDAVLELGEDVGAVVDAQPVTGAEILVDPDAHGGNER